MVKYRLSRVVKIPEDLFESMQHPQQALIDSVKNLDLCDLQYDGWIKQCVEREQYCRVAKLQSCSEYTFRKSQRIWPATCKAKAKWPMWRDYYATLSVKTALSTHGQES